MARKKLRLFLIILVLLGGLVALAPTLAGGFVASKVEQSLETSLRADVSIDDLSLGWFSGLDVAGVKIVRQGDDAMDVQVDSITCKPSLLDLLGDALVARDIEVKGVRIEMTRPRGSAPPPASEKESGPLPRFDLRAKVRDITIVWNDPALDAPVAIESIDEIEATVRTGEEIVVTMRDAGLVATANVTAFDGDTLRETDAFESVLKIKGRDLDLGHWAGAAAPWIRALAGRLTVDETVTMKGGVTKAVGSITIAALSGDLVAGGITPAFDDVTVETDLAWDGAADGKIKLQAKQGRLEGLPGLARALNLESAVLDATLSRDGRIDIGQASAYSRAGTVEVSGWANSGDGSCSLKVRSSGDMTRLADVIGGLPAMSGALASGATVARTAKGDLVLRGQTRISRFEATDLPGGVPPIREREILVSHDLDWSTEAIDLKKVGVTSSFLNATAQGRLATPSKGSPSGTVKLGGTSDLRTLGALLGDHLPVDMLGKLSFDATVQGRDDGTALDAVVDTDGLSLTSGPLGERGLEVGTAKVTANGVLSSDRRTLTLPKLKVASPLLQFDGALDYRRRDDGAGIAVRGTGAASTDDLLDPFLDDRTTRFRRSSFDIDIERTPAATTVNEATVNVASSTATARGVLGTGEALDVTANLALQQLVDAWGADLPAALAGRLELGGKVRHQEGETFAALDYSFTGLQTAPDAATLKDSKRTNLRGRIGAHHDSNAGSTRLDELTILGPGLDLDLSGSRVAGTTTDLEMKGTSNLTHLGAFLRPWLPADVTGYAKVSGSVSKGDGGFGAREFVLEAKTLRAALEERGTLTGDFIVKADMGGSAPFDVSVHGTKVTTTPAGGQTVRMSQPLIVEMKGTRRDDMLDITSASVTADGIKLGGSGKWERGKRLTAKTKGDLDLPVLAKSWLTLAWAEASGRGKGAIDLDIDTPLDLAGARKSSRGHLVLSAPHLGIPGLSMDDLATRASLENGLARVTEGSVLLNGGATTFGGSLDLRPEVPKLTTKLNAKRVQIRKEMQPAIARVVPIFAGLEATVLTFANVDVDLAGEGDGLEAIKPTLTGGGNVSCDDGKVVGSTMINTAFRAVGLDPTLDFKGIQSSFTVKNGAVHQDAMLIDGTGVDLRVGGITHLDGRLEYELGIRPEGEKAAKFRQFAAILDKDGFLPLGLGGTISAPALAMPDPSKLIGNTLEKALKDKLPGGLRGLFGPKKKKKNNDK